MRDFTEISGASMNFLKTWALYLKSKTNIYTYFTRFWQIWVHYI